LQTFNQVKKMKTDFDIFNNKDLFAPVVFRADFNKFNDINVNQAWSLFLTAGKEDKALGINNELGKFFSNTLAAIIIAGSIGAIVFSHVA
jgi:hypothetical protein